MERARQSHAGSAVGSSRALFVPFTLFTKAEFSVCTKCGSQCHIPFPMMLEIHLSDLVTPCVSRTLFVSYGSSS